MKRVKLFILGVPLVLLLFCAFEPDYPEYNDIDAVASATMNISVRAGRAYDTYAILETYHKDGYRFHFIGYGLGITDSIYPDTLMVADTPRVVICTLTDLIPNSKYNYVFRGEYPENAEIP